MKYVRPAKNSNGANGVAKSHSKRFEILNKEMEVNLGEENQQPHAKFLNSKLRGNGVLTEITNAQGSYSTPPEKANKVAQKVNGMHVYRWPITVKVTSYDWNNKRYNGRFHNGDDPVSNRKSRGDWMKKDGVSKGSGPIRFAQE
ncbi:hypothetical protein LWI28_017234 [Acer negundo]|uniref:Uncharacterized protein n=1 Tax=Acer negundo TaxID=4023 RepID=A0AAD5NLU4_ACENE|nr:hypothetical protein LWI28_017234 [Acer negundo]